MIRLYMELDIEKANNLIKIYLLLFQPLSTSNQQKTPLGWRGAAGIYKYFIVKSLKCFQQFKCFCGAQFSSFNQ